MANLFDATYRQMDEGKTKEHDNKLIETQIKLLNQIQSSTSYTQAAKYAEAYALISGKLGTKTVEIPKG